MNNKLILLFSKTSEQNRSFIKRVLDGDFQHNLIIACLASDNLTYKQILGVAVYTSNKVDLPKRYIADKIFVSK